jgi:Uma2 family endonuclease
MSIAAKYRPYYTYDDYCQWEGQWELIEGMPYSMAPMAIPQHQRANFLLGMAFEKALANCKKCKVYPPLEWKIAEDTSVQPDLLIVCNKIEKKFLDFPPALVVEILSPSTVSKDRGEKMELYLSQKVKYYLIVDPQFKKVEVYELINNQYEPVAVNPDTYIFSLEEDCIAEVSLTDIWE